MSQPSYINTIFHRLGRLGSKDSKYRRTSKLHDWFISYDDLNNVFCP